MTGVVGECHSHQTFSTPNNKKQHSLTSNNHQQLYENCYNNIDNFSTSSSKSSKQNITNHNMVEYNVQQQQHHHENIQVFDSPNLSLIMDGTNNSLCNVAPTFSNKNTSKRLLLFKENKLETFTPQQQHTIKICPCTPASRTPGSQSNFNMNGKGGNDHECYSCSDFSSSKTTWNKNFIMEMNNYHTNNSHYIINECNNTTTTTTHNNNTIIIGCENVSRKHENFVNYQQEPSSSKHNNITTTTRTTKYSLIGRSILTFTYLIFIYYLLISTLFNFNILTYNYINKESHLIVHGYEEFTFLQRGGSPRLVGYSYPVTCSPYPTNREFQILSSGLPTSGALGNGTVITLPSTSTFANYIVMEPWLVVFPSLTSRRTTIGTTKKPSPKPQEPPRSMYDNDDTIRVRRVASSYTHTIVIGDEEAKSSKYLFGFGLNDNNSLGLSTELNQSVMVDPSDDDGVLDLDKSSSTIVPDLSKKDIRKKPNKIPSSQTLRFDDISDVFAGDGFTVVLTKGEKQLYTCGRNNKYQLGLESKKGIWNQLPIKNVSLVDTGADHTVITHNSYYVAFFGSNANQQMGNVTLKLEGSSQSFPISKTIVPLQFDMRSGMILGPVPKQKTVNIVSVQASRYFTLMLTHEGSLVFFGLLENAFRYPNIMRGSNFLDTISFGSVPIPLGNIGSLKDDFVNVDANSKFETIFTGYYLDRFYFSSGISKILACDKFFVVLMNNNTVWISDNSFRGVPSVGPLVDPVLVQKQVSKMVCGRKHLVFLMQDNTAYTVGSNYYGQLGLKGVSSSSKLNFVKSGVSDIEAADFTTFLIANQSRLYSFGMNNMGQLGVSSFYSTRSSMSLAASTSQDSFAVVDFSTSLNFTIGGGPYQTFIASLNGTYAAGLNYNNMFGIDGSPEKLYSPASIDALRSPVRIICATLQNTFAIRDSTNELIMLGQSGYIEQEPPYGIPKGVAVANVTCGAYHILVTDTQNTLYAAGYNGNGQLGIGFDVNSAKLVPVSWSSQNGKVYQTSCGAKHSLVLSEKGVFAFGDNTYGQLGISGLDKSSTPIKLPIENAVGVYAGFYHSHVLTRNGTILAFGRNDYQQLGPLNGGGSMVATPTTLNMPYSYGSIVDIKSGAFHTLMLTSTGTVYAYGNNDYGQLGFALDKSVTSAELKFGTTDAPRIALSVAAGAFHSIILTSPYVQGICPSVKCSSVSRSFSSVCSANGTCIANDLCMCYYGYTGTNCQYYSCFGKSSSDPDVCNGSGACVGIDKCTCYSNATGSNCQNSVNTDSDLTLAIALPLTLTFAMLLVLGFIFLVISLTLFFKKEKKKKLEERETSSGTESINNNNKTDLESNLTLSVDKNFELNLVGTPVSGSDPYSTNKSGNIRTFLNISQVSTAMTLTKSMMDDYSGNNLQLSSASQNRLNGGESMLIDRFVNLMKIGEGSFGLVFKGQDTKQSFQWKAIKLIRFSDLNELNQTLREATHLLRMVHPHIVRVNDVFIDANQHMLCMEMDYYELGDFEQFMNNQCYLGQSVLSETLVSQLIYQICSALDYMNTEYNMIHRDIKPSNIFIKSFDYHRSLIHIVLGDFGLAKKGRNSISGSTGNPGITRVSDSSDINLSQELATGDANTLLSTQMGFAGTPIYMSWEAIVQGKNCFQTDIFALGVTAYQCLTGDRQTCITQLYLKEHQRRQLNLHLMSSEKDVENLVRENIIKCSPNCSIQLVDLIMQMLKKNPEDRPKPSDVTNSAYFTNKC